MEEQFYVQGVKVGMKVPEFEAEALMPNGEFGKISLKENMDKGLWTVLFFWPMDFTFVCPTEIIALSNANKDFEEMGAKLYGASTDSIYVHQAWVKTPINQGGIGEVEMPLIDDKAHLLSELFGVLIDEEGIALRGLFIIDDKGILQSSVINNLSVGRSVDETLRTLQAFQSGGLCPANWKKGDKTL